MTEVDGDIANLHKLTVTDGPVYAITEVIGVNLAGDLGTTPIQLLKSNTDDNIIFIHYADISVFYLHSTLVVYNIASNTSVGIYYGDISCLAITIAYSKQEAACIR